MRTVDELKVMIDEVMTTLGIHQNNDGGYSVDAEPDGFVCASFPEALGIALDWQRRATHEEIAEGIHTYLLGVERRCTEARTPRPQVIQ